MAFKRYIENKISIIESQIEKLKEFKELLDEWNQIIVDEQKSKLSIERNDQLVQRLKGVYSQINPLLSKNKYLADGSHAIPVSYYFQTTEFINEIPSFSLFIQLPKIEKSNFVRRAQGISCRMNMVLPFICGSLTRRRNLLKIVVNLSN